MATKRKRLQTDALTLAWCRERNWLADLAERRTGRVSRDYLGFADVVALDELARPIAIQHTSHANLSSRRRKVLGSTEAQEWAYRGGTVLLLGWRDEDRVQIEDLTDELVILAELADPE